MADTSFDIIIIGSGPGGYVTAIRAAISTLVNPCSAIAAASLTA